MFKYYVDKRTINNQPDQYGHGYISYRMYHSEMPWSEVKKMYTEEEIPHLLLVVDTEMMREIVDPGNKQEIIGRKDKLIKLINSIYDDLCRNDKLTYDNQSNQSVSYGNNHYVDSRYANELESEYEKITYETQYAEAKAFAESNYSDLTVCPNLVTIATTANRDLIELTKKIINKHETQINRSIKYLGYKQKNISFIESQNNVSKLREMFSDYRWVDFGDVITTQQVYEYITNQSNRFEYFDQFNNNI